MVELKAMCGELQEGLENAYLVVKILKLEKPYSYSRLMIHCLEDSCCDQARFYILGYSKEL